MVDLQVYQLDETAMLADMVEEISSTISHTVDFYYLFRQYIGF